MEKKYRNVYLFFIAILILVPIGFKSYFLKLTNLNSIETVLHIHNLLMTIWCLMLIIQPLLIRKRKNNLHKTIGKVSYFFFPLVVYSIGSTIFYSFERMKPHLSLDENLSQIFLPISQLFLFTLFYVLAILNTKKIAVHMRYIIISSISLFGPTIGRIDFGLGEDFNTDLWFMNACLLIFLLYDKYYNKNYKSYLIGLFFFVIIHIANVWFANTELWRTVAKNILRN